MKRPGRLVYLLFFLFLTTGGVVLTFDHHFQLGLVEKSLIVLGVAILSSLVVARFVEKPLQKLAQKLEATDASDERTWPAVADFGEVHQISQSLRHVLVRFREILALSERQANERGAILSSMTEGVLALDLQQRIIDINDACAQILGIRGEMVKGRPVQEIVRNYELLSFVEDAVGERGESEAEIFVRGEINKTIQLHSSSLLGERGQIIGVLVVLNDITRIRNLENLRKEFVANVSHELRTPITSIQGFVEALEEGAIDDPENARKFLGIISKQVRGLKAIIDDLLTLSTVEQTDQRGIERLELSVQPLLLAAAEVCANKAVERHIKIDVRCPTELKASVNGTLLEQAVINLVDNAVKYSDEGKSVIIEGMFCGEQLIISVSDQGWGISPEDLPRVFERFYRVEKARSRKLGGTGLGLAIVKHVAIAHQGRAYVESTIGKGSKFYLEIPRSA